MRNVRVCVTCVHAACYVSHAVCYMQVQCVRSTCTCVVWHARAVRIATQHIRTLRTWFGSLSAYGLPLLLTAYDFRLTILKIDYQN